MIISLRHNYIYIRTRKTASSTIEAVLKERLGPDDLYIREDLSVIAPIAKTGVEIPASEYFVTHITAAEIRPLIRDDIWGRLFKFTSERHPYEKAVSEAYFRQRREKRWREKRNRKPSRADFAAYLDEAVNAGSYAGFAYYAIDGRSIADDVIRHETLHDDLKRIGAKLGFAVPDKLPRKRVSERDDPRPARDILSPAQRDVVYERCRAEFDLLEYAR